MSGSPPTRIFTVGEANRLIGPLEAVMDRIGRLRVRVERHHEGMQVLDALWGSKVLDSENPDHDEFETHRAGVDQAAKLIETLVRNEILARGIRFPTGGLEHGLLDFPTTLDGRVVYLCWQRGETQIGWWHEVRGGFAGRKRITAADARRMGVDAVS